MEFKEPSTQTEAAEALSKFREQWPATLDTSRVIDAFEWLEKLDNRWEQMHFDVLNAMAELTDGTMEPALCRRVVDYLKRNSHRCKGDPARLYVGIAIFVHLVHDESTTTLAQGVLLAVRPAIYKDDATLASVVEMFKMKLVPKMKELADAKKFADALTLWRAMIRFTGFERIPTAVTNGVLHIATMAFKEADPNVHVDAFSSWRILVESLPRYMLKKAPYIKLLLNPLNRVYRDTDAVTTPHKFSAWWQIVRSLDDDLEAHFDDVVFPLINKVFGVPSAKARQVNPTAFANPTREIPQEAYAVLVLVLYKGTVDIMTEMSNLNANLPLNQHTIKDACFAKHQTLLSEVFTLVLNNITNGVSPPPDGYPYLLAKVLLSRITTLYNGGHHGLVRAFLSTIYKLLQAKLFNTDQILSVFTDLANGVPQKVMVSSQFNLRDGSSSMHECPIMSLTAFFVQHVPVMCEKERPDAPAAKIAKNNRQYRHLLKVLLECGSAGMNFLYFADHVSKSLAQAEGVLQIDSWLEVADHLASFIKHTHEVNQGGSLEHDFSALINTLKYPFRPTLSMTADIVKKWTDLFTVFAIDAALVKDVGVNQHIEELCAHLLDELSKTEFDLNRLLLCSQAFETVTKQASLETVSVGKKIPLGNLHSFVKCISLLAKSSHAFIQCKKQLKSNCHFFVNILHICTSLIQRTNDSLLCRHLLLGLAPELVPLLEHTKTKAACRETSLTLVELPLLHALAAFAEAFVDKAEKTETASSSSSNDDEKFSQMVRSVIEHGSGHWKANIREPFVRYAKLLCVPFAEPEQLSQSLSQVVAIPDIVSVTAQSKASAKATTPSSTGATAKRRSSRKVSKDDEEFTPIKTTTKKKPIFTEHQLEKLSESKILPSMYQDLSQSIDKMPSQQGGLVHPVVVTETRVIAPVIDEDAVFDDITPKKCENDNELAQDEAVKRNSKARRSLAGKDTDTGGVKPIDPGVEGEDIKELQPDIKEFQPVNEQQQPSPVDVAVDHNEVATVTGETRITVDSNNENEEPVVKKKRRFSYNESDEMPESMVVTDQQPSTLTKMVEMMQNEQQQREKEEAAQINSPLRPQGARKRKLTGQSIESPITAKLQQRNFLINSPSSRSRMMLEAAQARHTMNANPSSSLTASHSEARHSLAGTTPRREKPITSTSEKTTEGSTAAQLPATAAGLSAPAAAAAMSPNVGRSILKRVSTGASAKKVSFSRANEVCAYDKHPRVSTAKSLFPPVIVQSDQNSSIESSDCLAQDVGHDETIREEDAAKLFGDDLLPSPSPAAAPAPTVTEVTVETAASADNEKLPLESTPVRGAESNTANADSDCNETSVAINSDEPATQDQAEANAPVGSASSPEQGSPVEATSATTSVPSGRLSPPDHAANNCTAAVLSPIESKPIESTDIVDCLKSAPPEKLAAVLEYVTSDEFVKSLSPTVRGAFFAKFLMTASSYQCHH